MSGLASLLLALYWLTCAGIALAVAQKQGGGLLRRLGAATVVASVASAPAAVLACVATHWEVHPSEWYASFALIGLAVFWSIQALQQPFAHAIPLDDPGITEALARVARRAGLHRVPPLMKLRTLGAMPAYGWVAVPHAPVVILADGLVHRLDDDEREAILAHEIAHVRSGSLWWLMLPLPVAATLSMAALPWLDLWVVTGSTWALGAFLTRVVTRPTELLCDREAGRLTSPAAMISALRKVHALHPLRDPGWRWTLTWALATHPPVQLRLHALGEDQGPIVRRLRWASRLAFAAWLVLYGAVIAAWFLLPSLPGFFVATALTALGLGLQLSPRLAGHAAHRRRRRLAPRIVPGRRTSLVSFWVLMASTGVIMLGVGTWWPLLLALGSIGGMLVSWVLRRGYDPKLVGQQLERLQASDLAGARQFGQDHPRAMRKDPLLRHNVALASLACGLRQEGLEALARLTEEAPRLLLAAHNLGWYALETDPALSLRMGERLRERMPDDPLGDLLSCAALRRLGRTDEARAAWDQACALDPTDPGVAIQAVELALDAGDLEQADRWVLEAEARAPGELELVLARARLALARDRQDEARGLLDRARANLADNPLSALTWRVEALAAALGLADGYGATTEPQEDP